MDRLAFVDHELKRVGDPARDDCRAGLAKGLWEGRSDLFHGGGFGRLAVACAMISLSEVGSFEHGSIRAREEIIGEFGTL